jgi:catechol 2,3-dioxygenase-like lactoylglutathione lyase family enzyme
MPDTGIHHVAYACRDLQETHHFYAELMGFELVHTEVKDLGDGFFRHAFYDTGDGSAIAFFDLHGAGEDENWTSGVSTGNGLPVWVNHIAFGADEERMEGVRSRMDAAGVDSLMEVDHGWCHSLYYVDPNGIMVEMCRDTPGIEPDPELAQRRLDSTESTDESELIL